MRFDLSAGFPLLTTKKLAFRWIAEELFWMLSGSTYEPHLRENGDHLLNTEYRDLVLDGYDPHPAIKAEVSV